MQHALSNLTKLCTLTTALLLTACGGGGEGDDDDANNHLNPSTAYKLAGTGTSDAANGQTLYNENCVGCHKASFANAKDSTKTISAIAGNKGGMGSLRATIKTQQSDNIAYYLANGNSVATTTSTSTTSTSTTSTSTTSSVGSTTTTTIAPAIPAINGKALYNDKSLATFFSCASASCHTTKPSSNINNVLKGANSASTIQNAINRGTGGMDVYIGKITTQQLNDIASYLATPNI